MNWNMKPIYSFLWALLRRTPGLYSLLGCHGQMHLAITELSHLWYVEDFSMSLPPCRHAWCLCLWQRQCPGVLSLIGMSTEPLPPSGQQPGTGDLVYTFGICSSYSLSKSALHLNDTPTTYLHNCTWDYSLIVLCLHFIFKGDLNFSWLWILLPLHVEVL